MGPFRLPFRSRRRIEADIAAEFAFHVEQRVAALTARGVGESDARAQAQAEFGDAAGAAEYCRSEDLALERQRRRADWLADAAHDLRHGLRQLRLRPGFAAAAALTLALGIGATTAIFSLVDALVLRPLPYPDAPRLVAVLQLDAGSPGPVEQISYGDFHAMRAEGPFESFALYLTTGLTVTGEGPAQRVNGRAVSGDYFPLLGTRTIVGRTLAGADATGSGAAVAVLAYGFWQARYGGDTAVVGRTISVNGAPLTVVGILAEGPALAIPNPAVDVYIPLTESGRTENRGFYGYYGVARMRPGSALGATRAALTTLGARYEATYPNSNAGRSFTALPLRTALYGDARPTVLALFGAAAFVLLIAGVNLTNLLLARFVTREREFAVRAALGASRSRLVRQLMMEIQVLTVAGAAAGLALAQAGLRAVAALEWPDALTARALSLDGRVLGFGLLLALLSGVAVAAGTALGRPERWAAALRAGARGSAGRWSTVVRRALVATETALAFVLLVGAGLMLATMAAALRTHPGFDTRNLLAIRVAPLPGRFANMPEAAEYFARFAEELRAVPGIAAVTLSSQVPLSGDRSGTSLGRADRPVPPSQGLPTVNWQVVAPGFFAALGIPLIAGREFTEEDRAQRPHRVVISEEVARRHFPGENPLGRLVLLGTQDTSDQHEIIGIVRAIRHHGLTAPPLAGAYDLYGQHGGRSSALLIRTSVPPASLLPVLREHLARFDGDAPLYAQATLEELARRTVADRRTVLVLLGVFAGIALALAVVGIYGVTAQAVRARMREYGIRLALGAAPGRVRAAVLGSGFALALAGVGAGAVGAAALTRTLQGLLYGVAPLDPRAFALAGAVLLVVALLAVLGPAVRASRVDVAGVLREE